MSKENKKQGTTFCKKFKLSPVPAIDRKKWNQRVNEYFDQSVYDQETYKKNYQKLIEKSEKEKVELEHELDMYDSVKNKNKELKDKVEKYQKRIKTLTTYINKWNKDIKKCDTKIKTFTAEKEQFNSIVKIGIVTQADNDFINKVAKRYTTDLVRRCCISEAQRKNTAMSFVYAECLKKGVHKYIDSSDVNKEIGDLFNFANRTMDIKKVNPDNPYCLEEITGMDNPLKGYGHDYKQALKKSFLVAVKNGLFEGKVSLPSFRMDNPFTVEKTRITIFPSFDLINIESYKDVQKIIQKDNGKVYLWLGSHAPDIAKFELDFGSKKKNRADLYSLLYDLLKQNYDIGGSSFEYDAKKNVIMFNLTIKKPYENDKELDENTIVGVDLGTNVPAVCALNNHDFVKKYIGSKEDFLRTITKFKHQKQRIQNAQKILDNKGKKASQQALDRITKRRQNWCKNFNHLISKRVVEFALSNNAKYIHLEKFSESSKDNKDKNLLKEWSYYQLQQMIEYKAKNYGIIVRYVKPEKTSVRCSCCGCDTNTERIKNAYKNVFVCHNEDCANNGKEINADYNAAKNIALSTNFANKNEEEAA